MLKDFGQMTEEELEHFGELEYDDEGLFQQLGEINQPPDYIVNALQNNEYSANSKIVNCTGKHEEGRLHWTAWTCNTLSHI